MQTDKNAFEFDIDRFWDDQIIRTLSEYIAIPALSVDFDKDWQANGHLEKAKLHVLNWLHKQVPHTWQVTEHNLPGKSPLLLVEIPAYNTASDNTVLMYGHLDKQPEMEGWWPNFGPWQPVMKDGKLYGRGGADDGYALFAAVAAIKALEDHKMSHCRIVILIEFSEESGSPDLPPYLEQCKNIIGEPDFVIALDSGAGDYERLWSTTSLRGMLSCVVTVGVLTEATHSGIASGIVPSSMRIMRQLLDRIEDVTTGEIRIEQLHSKIPEQRIAQAKLTADVLGDEIIRSFNTVTGLSAVSAEPNELLLNNTWRPTLCVVGQEGIPKIKDAGNVLRAYTRFKLSFRLPPNVKYSDVQDVIAKVITEKPPYDANVQVTFDQGGDGWDAPPLATWLEKASSEASTKVFDKDAAYFGLGASIPFMAMLGEMYPKAQFLITGVLGPKSNAHGPNEFIDIPYAKKLTACVAYIVNSHAMK